MPSIDNDLPDNAALIAAYLDHLRDDHGLDEVKFHAGAIRHFVFWLKAKDLTLDDADDAIIERFRRHKCRCSGRSRSNPQRKPIYLSRVRRFLRFVCERSDQGRVAQDALLLAQIDSRVTDLGYSNVTAQSYRSEAEHFLVWLRAHGVERARIDDALIDRFAHHDCHCAIRRKRGNLKGRAGPARRRRGARFVLAVMQDQGIALKPVDETGPALDSAYADWLRRDKGLRSETIRRYLSELGRWRHEIEDAGKIDVALVRRIVREQPHERSHSSVCITATVLRSWLGFLAIRGDVSPTLLAVVPSTSRRTRALTPGDMAPETINALIAACDVTVPIGLRDRAILLLLARLGLRAGDIRDLRIDQIEWGGATLLLTGKGGRSERMPLPQDVGDVLLDYLERGRPRTLDGHVFVRDQAPHRAFSSSAEIAGIVSRARARAGVTDGPTGAHAFRHALATGMLRQGSGLEMIGTVLRHASTTTTALYARSNTAMLATIAQPWPGDASC